MADLTFATHMLDGFDVLYKRTEEVLKSTQEFGNFFRKVSAVETEYAKSLSKVAQVAASKKAKSSATEKGTVKDAWDVIHNELDRLANKHQEFSNQLGDLFGSVSNAVKDKGLVRRKLVQNGMQLTTDLSAIVAANNKARVNYESKCKAADVCQQAFLKAKTDGNIKPKEVTKLSSKAQKALEASNVADKEYKKALSKANEKQRAFYEKEMPELLQEFQRFEEDRIVFIKETLETYSRLQNEFPGFLDERGKAIHTVVSAVNAATDIQLYLQQNQTGLAPPPDIEYKPYVSENPGFTAAQTSAGVGSPSAPGIPAGPAIGSARGGSGTMNEVPKEYGLTDQDESLGTEEKIAKLQSQLGELREAIKAETKSKKGLEKLVKFYASDPVAQDKAKGELEDQKRKISNMKDTRQQLDAQLAELSGVEGGLDANYEDSYEYQGGGDGGEQEEYSSEVCQARALYDYEATNDTELSFAEGDILTVTERDDSGWWFAELNGQTGFVPNNYVKVV